jgi:glycosyltransferase involved in cell wall biosynthesis
LHDLSSLELTEICSVVPTNGDLGNYYCTMDAFALTSREEALGLVALEAAEYELPVVCYRASGGAEEFVIDDAGIQVPYLDNVAFATSLVRLCDDPALCAQMGQVGRARVNQSYRVEVQGPKLLRSIQQCMGEAAEMRLHSTTSSFAATSAWQAKCNRDGSG